MKFKNKTFLGLFSGFAVTILSATLVSASFSIRSVPNKLNSLYSTLMFTSKDEDVTFSGNTIVKLRKGKKFGSVIPPVAMKPNAKFKNWVIYIDDQEVVVDPSFVITEDNMVIIPTFEIIGERCHVMFDTGGECEFVSGLQELDVESGIMFDNVPKPRAIVRNYEAYIIGWREEHSELLLTPDTVINKNMNILPVVENRYKRFPGKEKPVDLSMTLNFTATSDNASVTWVREGDYGKGRIGIGIIPDYVDMDNFYVQNGDERVHQPITIPKGHSVSIVGGSFYGPEPREFDDVNPFSINEDNYSHFIITGDVWVSGSINGLLNNGHGPEAAQSVENLTRIGEDKGQYIFYKLFANADKESPNSHLHISQNINSQDYPFLGSCVLSGNCYANMFEGCDITSIPYTLLAPYDNVLSTPTPSGQLVLMSACYSQMFHNCQKIDYIPSELFHPRPDDPSPISESGERAYYGMFDNCTGIKTLLPNLFQYIDLSCNEIIANMFYGCINLRIYDDKCSYESILIINGSLIPRPLKIPDVFTGCVCFGFDGTLEGGHNYYVGI